MRGTEKGGGGGGFRGGGVIAAPRHSHTVLCRRRRGLAFCDGRVRVAGFNFTETNYRERERPTEFLLVPCGYVDSLDMHVGLYSLPLPPSLSSLFLCFSVFSLPDTRVY